MFSQISSHFCKDNIFVFHLKKFQRHFPHVVSTAEFRPILQCNCFLFATFKVTGLFGIMLWQCPVHGSIFGSERRSPTHLTRLQTKSLYLNICKRCAEAEDILWQSCRRGWEGYITSGCEGVGWLVSRAGCSKPTNKEAKTPPTMHTQKGGGVSVRQKNGHLKWQGPGGRDLPDAWGAPAEPLQHSADWREDPWHQEWGWSKAAPSAPCVTTSTTSKGDRWE